MKNLIFNLHELYVHVCATSPLDSMDPNNANSLGTCSSRAFPSTGRCESKLCCTPNPLTVLSLFIHGLPFLLAPRRQQGHRS